jgi:hypothetical protein
MEKFKQLLVSAIFVYLVYDHRPIIWIGEVTGLTSFLWKIGLLNGNSEHDSWVAMFMIVFIPIFLGCIYLVFLGIRLGIWILQDMYINWKRERDWRKEQKRNGSLVD